MLEQAYITPRLILKRVFGKDTELRTLLKTMQEEIESMRKVVGIDYSPITINRYVNVLNKLKAAVPRFYGKEDITFFELTPDFIKSFDTFLKTEAGLCRNTIVRYMKCLKRIVNMALAKEWMRKDPFYGYKMQQDETDPVFLTYGELKAIMNKDFKIPRLELVRDVFVFACHTGLAFSDISTLTRERPSEAGAPPQGFVHQQRSAAARSSCHIEEIREPSTLRKDKPLPARDVQSENEQLP